QTCVGVLSAEGEMQCGQIPQCSSKLCKTSADCADLGEGYFCDTPLSGCCSDPPCELARCITPVKAAPSTESLSCGTKCCQPGERCERGVCTGNTTIDVAGRWRGVM